jgi:Domain of unknown function (DUF4166)
MGNSSLLQKTLGDDWHKLPLVIQTHYRLQSGQQTHNIVTGIMRVNYPVFVRPMLFITRLMGGLIDLKGDNMNARVEKWVSEDAAQTLFWKRTIQASDGKCTVFASRMEYQQGNELIEYVGGGFGLRLKLSVENNKLVYRSNGHLWQIGKVRIPIPDVLFLGHATIIETAISENHFELDFRINHPWFGETYRYGGVFQLQNPTWRKN